jgi:hypothetical protein
LFFCPLHPKGNAAIFLPEIGGAGDLSMQKLLQFSQKNGLQFSYADGK